MPNAGTKLCRCCGQYKHPMKYYKIKETSNHYVCFDCVSRNHVARATIEQLDCTVQRRRDHFIFMQSVSRYDSWSAYNYTTNAENPMIMIISIQREGSGFFERISHKLWQYHLNVLNGNDYSWWVNRDFSNEVEELTPYCRLKRRGSPYIEIDEVDIAPSEPRRTPRIQSIPVGSVRARPQPRPNTEEALVRAWNDNVANQQRNRNPY